MTDLLFQIPPPMTWKTDQVANIISVISAVGTVGALWYAYHLERKNSKKINDLATIASKLTEQTDLQRKQYDFLRYQLKVQAKPDFIVQQSFDAFGLLEFKILVLKNPIFIRYFMCADRKLTAKAEEEIWVRESETYMATISKNDDSKKYHEYDLRFFISYHDVHSNHYEGVIIYEKEKWTIESVDVVAPLDRKPTTHL